MNRVTRILLILLWFELGFAVLILPWMDAWGQNFFLTRYPQLIPIILNTFFRGAVSGLGLINMLFAGQAMLFSGQKTIASEN